MLFYCESKIVAMKQVDEHALLLTALEKSEGLCPVRSDCKACGHVEYVYFVGVLCRAEVRRIDAGGLCLSRQATSD